MQWDGGAIARNAPDWLRAWVQRNFRRRQYRHLRRKNISSLGAAVQHNFRRTLLVLSREENFSSLDIAVRHNFRRTLLVPSSEDISSLGAAVQHNFRRTLLVPSREENISSLGAALQHNLAPTMDFRPREAPFFGDYFFRLGPIAFKFSHTSFQPKRRFLSIWSIIRVLVIAS